MTEPYETPENYIDRLAMNLPDVIKKLRAFLVWRLKLDPIGKKKPGKVPYYIDGAQRHGKQGTYQDRARLATFADAVKAFENGGYAGLGLAMLPDSGLVAMDLDHCYSNGKIKSELAPLVADTYVEVSPGGNGVRAFYQGSYPKSQDHHFGVEVFPAGQFVTLTGDAISYNPIIPLPDAVKRRLDLIFQDWKPAQGVDPSNDPIFQHLKTEAWIKRVRPDGKVDIHCPFEKEHTTASGDGDCTYFPPGDEYKLGNFHCLHAHCVGRKRNDFLQAIGYQGQRWDHNSQEHKEKTSKGTENKSPDQDPLKILSGLTVNREYTDMLGDEEWFYPNLIIKNQVTAIIALSGGGKSTIAYNFLCPRMLKEHPDLHIMFFDVDSPASDHQQMIEKAEGYGHRFEWINPLTHGKDETIVREMLEQVVKLKRPMHNYLMIFDTLKKFCYLLSKEKVRDFFKLMRSLTSLGATILLLGHANKYRLDGLLVPEGVGDVKNDTDALIIFERIAAVGGMHVSSVVDHDKNAKVRGLYEPVTFHIEQGTRVVTAVQDYVTPPNYTASAKDQKLTDDETLDLIRDFLRSRHGHVSQSDVLNTLKVQVGYNRLFNILTANSVHENKAEIPGQIYYSVRAHNKRAYSVVDG